MNISDFNMYACPYHCCSLCCLQQSVKFVVICSLLMSCTNVNKWFSALYNVLESSKLPGFPIMLQLWGWSQFSLSHSPLPLGQIFSLFHATSSSYCNKPCCKTQASRAACVWTPGHCFPHAPAICWVPLHWPA